MGGRWFVVGETSFLARYWEDMGIEAEGGSGERAAAGKKALANMRAALKSGALEVGGGGWVQHDAALPTADCKVRQMTFGHRWLRGMGARQPTVGWQIDVFGASRTLPVLFPAMGLSNVVLNRIPFVTKHLWQRTGGLEFWWHESAPSSPPFLLPSATLLRAPIPGMVPPPTPPSPSAGVLAHVLYDHYTHPTAMSRLIPASLRTKSKDKARLVEALREVLVATVRARQAAYRTGHILVVLGDDFAWHDLDDRAYEMLEAVVARQEEVRDGGKGVRLQVSSPSRYFEAVRGTGLPAGGPAFGGDLLPYSNGPTSVWSGFYSLRPHLKQESRTVDAAVRAAGILLALAHHQYRARRDSSIKEALEGAAQDLDVARGKAFLLAHHDAITGTARSHVVHDYYAHLRDAEEIAGQVARDALLLLHARRARLGVVAAATAAARRRGTTWTLGAHGADSGAGRSDPYAADRNPQLLPRSGNGTALLVRCADLLHEGQFAAFPVVVYNPLSFARRTRVYVTVDCPGAVVLASDETEVPQQLNPVALFASAGCVPGCKRPTPTREDREESRLPDPTLYRLYWEPDLQALGSETYYIVRRGSPSTHLASAVWHRVPGGLSDFAGTSAESTSPVRRLLTEQYDVQLGGAGGELIDAIVTQRDGGREHRLGQRFLLYPSFFDGAYILRTEFGSFVAAGFGGAFVVTILLTVAAWLVTAAWRWWSVWRRRQRKAAGLARAGWAAVLDRREAQLVSAVLCFGAGLLAFSLGLRHFGSYGTDYGICCGAVAGLVVGAALGRSLRRAAGLVALVLFGAVVGLFGLTPLHGMPVVPEGPVVSLTLHGVLFTEHTVGFTYRNAENVGQIVQVIRIGTASGMGGEDGTLYDVEVSVAADSTPYTGLAMRWETSLASGGTFWTDNGLGLVAREHNVLALIPYNVYPSVGTNQLRDLRTGEAMTVAVSTAHGVTSLASGQLEMLLHRSPVRDDGNGLDEMVSRTENEPFLSTMWVTLPSSEHRPRQSALALDYRPMVHVLDLVEHCSAHQNDFHPAQMAVVHPQDHFHLVDLARQQGDSRTLMQVAAFRPAGAAGAGVALQYFSTNVFSASKAVRTGLSGWEDNGGITEGGGEHAALVCYDVTDALGFPIVRRAKPQHITVTNNPFWSPDVYV